jgi:hypothetical protein
MQSLRRLSGTVEDQKMISVRRAGGTSAATLLCLALTIVLAHMLAPNWTQRSGLDVWNLPTAVASSQTADQEAASLNAKENQLQREIELSDHVSAQLASGNLALKLAVDEMEPILQNRSGFAMAVKGMNPSFSFRQGVARYLISRVPRIMNNDPVLQIAVLDRLEYEYSELD